MKDRISSAKEARSYVPAVGTQQRSYRSVEESKPVHVAQTESGVCKLTIMQGKEYGKVYDLDQLVKNSGRRLLTMGRGSANGIFVEDYMESYISRRHCTIEKIGESLWQIRDGQWDFDNSVWVDSMNGTYVNSDKVSQSGKLLKSGDIITIGDTKLKFEL